MLSLLATVSNGNASQPGLGSIGSIAFAAAALAYLACALALVVLVRRRPDLAFRKVYLCFAGGALAAGLSHAAAVGLQWQPFPAVLTGLAVVAALISIVGAIALWALVPKVLVMPSAESLKATNEELAGMLEERDAALDELRAQIVQREQAEAALLQAQRLEAVGQLTSGVAHDFNNLLQAVAGNLELIARKPGDEDRVVRWSASALNAVERGRALTRQLLAFSRKQQRQVTSIRLVELIAGMKDLIERAVAPLSQVRVDPIDPSLNIEADPLQLELAVLNLAFNARDAMPEGGTLTLSAARHSGDPASGVPEGEYVALTIRDTGIGMPPEVLARAPEPFFTTKGEGTGMGLAMVAGALRESGGSLRIESEPGGGTAITLLLRVAKLEPRREVEDDARNDHRADLHGCSIALIDDDPQVRATLAEMLRGAGAEVREAGEGAEGLALVHERRPDLVVVDFAMPGMSGAEVARAVHEVHPGLRILVVTGFAESQKLDGIAGPDVTMLRKPFESHELLCRVTEMLGR
ncbi:ATP-binding protein [Sphingomonas sp. DT-207]|uniref:ATP-binding protein n=1 Tax=Sphingomonas sp. DT-207 TaxID=3396167 RepID=UPI003F1C0EBC